MELVYSLAGAVIGGLIVLLIQQIYQNRRENKRSKSTHSSVNLKKLDKEVLNILKPGVNLALSIDILGNPTRVFSEDDNFINDEMVMTNSYLYVFKNALLKITSEDNITIDTITLLTSDKSFEIKYLLPEFKMNSNKLNMAVINKEISSSVEHKFIAARHDYAFAFYYSIPNAYYIDVTLFSYCKGNWHEYFETKNSDIAINGEIFGICLSKYMSEKSFYIYQNELNS